MRMKKLQQHTGRKDYEERKHEPVVDLDAVQSKLVLADEKGTKALTKVNAMLAELGLKGLRRWIENKIYCMQ